MPSRNTIRLFAPHQRYHVYNRGVAKQPTFLDTQDYNAFMRRLQLALLPEDEADKLQHIPSADRIRLQNFSGAVTLEAFCLMPNHFHLLLNQLDDATAVTNFLTTLTTSYSMYFNRKYNRVGPVFQGRFKAAHVDNDAYYTHLSRYIHCNPIALGADIFTYPYSSQQYYFKEAPSWLETKELEQMFDSGQQYTDFLLDLRDLKAASEQYDL